MALTAGLDQGAKNTKIVVLDGDEVVARESAPTGFAPAAAVEIALDRALAQAGLERADLASVLTAGPGGLSVAEADARAAVRLHPPARTVVDVGAEEGRAVSTDGAGAVVASAADERCAAGAGAFTEAVSRALDTRIEDLGALSLASTRRVGMHAHLQCAVFAESELVALIHANTPPADIARAIHDAMAARLAATVRRVGLRRDVLLVGGVARNVGFKRSLEDDLGVEVTVPPHPELATALGAALVARDRLEASS
jgi:benzoyl-CoA reductase subunit D